MGVFLNNPKLDLVRNYEIKIKHNLFYIQIELGIDSLAFVPYYMKKMNLCVLKYLNFFLTDIFFYKI